jgi:cytochrome c-type biogenesis protein CcmH/NrfG
MVGSWKPQQIKPCSLIQSLPLYAQDYKKAVVAFEHALKIDPASDEIKKALRHGT